MHLLNLKKKDAKTDCMKTPVAHRMPTGHILLTNRCYIVKINKIAIRHKDIKLVVVQEIYKVIMKRSYKKKVIAFLLVTCPSYVTIH